MAALLEKIADSLSDYFKTMEGADYEKDMDSMPSVSSQQVAPMSKHSVETSSRDILYTGTNLSLNARQSWKFLFRSASLPYIRFHSSAKKIGWNNFVLDVPTRYHSQVTYINRS